MTTVVLAAYDVANTPGIGGHFWVYAQYADALRRLGCDVYWLEQLTSTGDPATDHARVRTLADRLERLGLADRLLVHVCQAGSAPTPEPAWVTCSAARAEGVFRRTDLLLNFHYAMSPELLTRFRRTALVDIDPGMLQNWWRSGRLDLHDHDVRFSIGENLPTDNGLWHHTFPAVSLELWPYRPDPGCRRFTTVSSWWAGEWLTDGTEVYDNNKRASFLAFADLPRRTDQELELALALSDYDRPEVQRLEGLGWRIRPAAEVAGSPWDFQAYVQSSRGEFSCAKEAYLRYGNGWISDRTVCYLASGKPAVVQHTGSSRHLPEGRGLFRFLTVDQAVAAFAEINGAYEQHCRAAREIAEEFFSARKVVARLLRLALA
ncbi:MAG: hypothetical protein ACRDV1_01190 [Actinomycetes bacterium]